MRKINLLFGVFIGLTILSCSSDDENKKDLIIGTWNPVSEKQIINGEEEINDFPCGEFTTYTYWDNGEFSAVIFNLDDSNNCVEITNTDISGNWKNVGNNIYKLSLFITTTSNGSSLTSEIVEHQEIRFKNSNNTMIILTNFNPEENNYNNSFTFTRVE